jgi:hypothetical protein
MIVPGHIEGLSSGTPCRVRLQTATVLLGLALLIATSPVGRCQGGSGSTNGFVLVSERNGSTVAKIDYTTDVILSRATVGSTPGAMAKDTVNRWVYIALNGANGIEALKADTMEVARLSTPGMGLAPIGVALTPDRTKLLVTTRGADGKPGSDDTLDIFSINSTVWPPTVSLAGSVRVGSHPINVVSDHNSRYAVVAVRNQPAIVIVDLQTYQVVAQTTGMAVDAEPEGVDIHPTANVAYVTLHGANSAIQLVDINSLTFPSSLPIIHTPAAQPSMGVFTPDGNRFFVAGQVINAVLMFITSDPLNPRQDRSVDLAVGSQPHHMVFLPQGKAYVANTGAPQQPVGSLSVIANYTGTPSVSGTILPSLYGPMYFACFDATGTGTVADTIAPVAGTASSSPSTNSGPIVVTYSGAFDTGGSGFSNVELWYRKGSGGIWTDSGLRQSTAAGQFSFTAISGDDTYYFDLVAVDGAGNRSAAVSGNGDCSVVYSTVVSKPDLTVSQVTMNPPSPSRGGVFSATVTVRNQGHAAARTVYVSVWADKAATPVNQSGETSGAMIGTINANQSVTYTFDGLDSGSGTLPRTFRAFVDSKLEIDEENESNNQTTTIYTPISSPDFVITRISLSSTTPRVGRTFTAYVTIRNQGLARGSPGYVDVWVDKPDEVTAGPTVQGDKHVSVRAMAPNTSQQLTFTGLSVGPTAVSRTFRALVDSHAATQEICETNNAATAVYTPRTR